MNALNPIYTVQPSIAARSAPSLKLAASNGGAAAHEVIGSSEFRQFLKGHHERVGEFSRIVAKAMGFSASQADVIASAGAMHDIGKLFVPEAVLQQPGPLNAEEQMAVRRHSFWGYVTLRRSEDPSIQLASIVALQHHESFDGSGYPFGLCGDEIRIEARIVSVCDIYDALRAARPYKIGFSHEEAMEKLLHGDERIRPSMFDPQVLAAFDRVQLLCRDAFERLYPRS
jgi:HD-GYP domain-containing protein (c-di-GMP phosphodiesterase class II)